MKELTLGTGNKKMPTPITGGDIDLIDKQKRKMIVKKDAKIRKSSSSSLGKLLDYCCHILPLMLCKRQLSFTRPSCAITSKNTSTIWRTPSYRVHLKHASSKSIPNGNKQHSMMCQLGDCRPTAINSRT